MRFISDFSDLMPSKSYSVFNWDSKWDNRTPETPEEWLEFADPEGKLGWDISFIARLVNIFKNSRYMAPREIMEAIEGIAMADENFEYYAVHGHLGSKFDSLFNNKKRSKK